MLSLRRRHTHIFVLFLRILDSSVACIFEVLKLSFKKTLWWLVMFIQEMFRMFRMSRMFVVMSQWIENEMIINNDLKESGKNGFKTIFERKIHFKTCNCFLPTILYSLRPHGQYSLASIFPSKVGGRDMMEAFVELQKEKNGSVLQQL